MPRLDQSQRGIVDRFASLTSDLAGSPTPASEHLRETIVSALRTSLRGGTPIAAPGLRGRQGPRTHIDAGAAIMGATSTGAREQLRRDLATAEASAGPVSATGIARRDQVQALLSRQFADGLSGLQPSETIGPFRAPSGIDVTFNVFFGLHRTTVAEQGSTLPSLVLTMARTPIRRLGTTRIAIGAGTVWVRGDLIDGSLPAGAFVGLRVDGGSLRLTSPVSMPASGSVVVAGALAGTMQLELASDHVPGVRGGCADAGARVGLPKTLTVTFGPGGASVQGSSGQAGFWGQTFDFTAATGGWKLVEALWTIVLEYDVNPARLDASAGRGHLAQFSGVAQVETAGLGLPVVVAPDPSLLGDASVGAAWYLEFDGIASRWYEPDPRFQPLGPAWVAVAADGIAILATAVAPLVPSLSHVYDLWTIRNADKRLPWTQTYAATTTFSYRCSLSLGEQLTALGSVAFAVDRPVTTDGSPAPLRTTLGGVVLTRFGDETTALLAALTEGDPDGSQFALRNALVWATSPAFVVVRGTLRGRTSVADGVARIVYGARAWAPILPDPYVSSASIDARAGLRGPARSILVAQVGWSTPEQTTIAFEGSLPPGPSLQPKSPSVGDARPAPSKPRSTDALTLVEQGTRWLDRDATHQRQAAIDAEQAKRAERAKAAAQRDRRARLAIAAAVGKAMGTSPDVLLLDVSTNQDLVGIGLASGGLPDRARVVDTGSLGRGFPVTDLAVSSPIEAVRAVMLPQVQWEPARTLDADQDIATLGWFPTPLGSATDGGPTQIGVRSQTLVRTIPEDMINGTVEAFRDGTPVGVLTTFPFGLIAGVWIDPTDRPQRRADDYGLTRPAFPSGNLRGGIQVTAQAESGRPDAGGISATFAGAMRQLLNGVDLASGAPLGLSAIGSTLDPGGSVETIFNDDMAAHPRVPVRRFDISGYGGSTFSDWNNPFSAFAETAKVQFRTFVGRNELEVVKVNSVLHPWGIRVTRSVTIERRPGGAIIRRDSGWQPFTPGLFDYRYLDGTGQITVAPYTFDAGIFRGFFNVRSIRPAPGVAFVDGTTTLIPYYFDADAAIEGVAGRTAAIGILGFLQTTPNGAPAPASSLQALIEAQGPIGGPLDAWLDFGASGLPFRAQRVEVGLAIDAGNPIFVATVRGAPRLPRTGAWSVVVRPLANVPAGGGEAVAVPEDRGVPIIRRYPIQYPADTEPRLDPPLAGVAGDYRFADAADLLVPAAPATEYALLQSTPTHAFLYPRPWVKASSAPRIDSGGEPAFADLFARSTSKGAFPPPENTIRLGTGSLHFDVAAGGSIALSAPISIVGYTTPLQLAGTDGHGSTLVYDKASIQAHIDHGRWDAEMVGLRIWSDITGLKRITGTEMRIVGSTEQRPQIAELRSLLLDSVEEILQYIPLVGDRGAQGPIDLGATNAKRELKVEAKVEVTIPKTTVAYPAGAGLWLKLSVAESTGIDITTGGPKASAVFGAELDGKIPVLSVGVASVFIIVTGKVTFSLTSVSGSVTAEKLDLLAFAGVGVEGRIGPFQAYAFLGVGFVLEYDAVASVTKYGGLVALEAGVDLKIVAVKIRAELKGLVYSAGGKTKCDYSGSVKIEVEIFLIFSISASYQVTDTTTL